MRCVTSVVNKERGKSKTENNEGRRGGVERHKMNYDIQYPNCMCVALPVLLRLFLASVRNSVHQIQQ